MINEPSIVSYFLILKVPKQEAITGQTLFEYLKSQPITTPEESEKLFAEARRRLVRYSVITIYNNLTPNLILAETPRIDFERFYEVKIVWRQGNWNFQGKPKIPNDLSDIVSSIEFSRNLDLPEY